MRPVVKLALLIVAATAAAASGCTLHRVTADPVPPVAIPDRWSAPVAAAAALPDRWWQAFGDPRLDQLAEEALAGNLQLRAAWARVRQARSLVRQARSGHWPQVDASAQASRTRQRFEIGEGMVFTPTIDSFQLSVAAAYEVDLWGRVKGGARAAALDAAAVRDDAEAIAMSLAAEVTEAWFDLASLQERRDLLVEQQRINDIYLELVELRARQGLASALDLFQQRQQGLVTRALIEDVDGTLHLASGRLALLLGAPPDRARWAVAPATTLPEPAALPALGVPADLLVRRPDIRAARRRAEAADHRIAVAIADRLPSLRIGGSAGFNAGEILELFDGGVFGLFAQLGQAVFDGGRRKAEVERSRDVVDERLLQLGQAMLGAIVEVENALAEEGQAAQAIATLAEQLVVATSTLDEARARYAEGLIDYLPVLTALASRQQLELQHLGARRARLSARIRLHRALGGGWTAELAVPARLGRRGTDATPGATAADGGARP